MCGIAAGTDLSKNQEISRQSRGTVGNHPERDGHGIGRSFVATYQQPSAHTRKSTGDTIRGDVFKIGHIRYRDPATTYRWFGIEGYRPVLFGEFNRDIVKTGAVKTVRGPDDTLIGSTFRTRGRR